MKGEDNLLSYDIKMDSLFVSEVGKNYLCSILSELLNIEFEDLRNNIKILNTEYPRSTINNKSSF
ncbi:MAG: hypothetical protein IJD92_02295 [Bacilli bacterium]|nr:hypothetical protein [Bacilli bacterium]